RQHGVHVGAAEGMPFGGALDFDETTAVIHHHVHVGVAVRVFGVIQVQHRLPLVNAHRNGRHGTEHGVALDGATFEQRFHGVDQGHVGAGDGGGAGAAVGLDDVATQGDHALAQ